jgi:GT2 family glycosyltransferase
MSVSVVIPTYNRVGGLQDVLNGLRRQTMRSFEVVVVNGPSTDGTAAHLAALGDAVRVLDNPERNLSRSRNLGIAAAAGELVAFLDDDAVPEPRWLEELVAPFADDRVAGVGGLVLDHTGTRVQWRHLVTSRSGEHDFEQVPPLDRFVAPGADPFLYVAGGNSAFRRAALAEVEGFDEEIEYNFDEAEVCLRLLDAGWRLVSLDAAVVHHHNLPSHQRTATAFTDPYFAVKNRVYFGLRHGDGGRVSAGPLASANRELGRLRIAARRAARAGRLGPAELAHHLGRADAGFHVGLQRALHGARRGCRLPPADPAAFRPFPVLDPSPRRRIALLGPGADALAAAGHEVHVLRPAEPDERYRIDYDDGVWVHHVPAVPRWLPELDDAPLRAPLERTAALRAALDRIRAGGPVVVEGAPATPLDGLLDAGPEEAVALLVAAGVDPAAAARVGPRLLEPHRFPADHEAPLRAALAEPDDGRFVDAVYAALVGRAPERFGRDGALRALREGMARRDFAAHIARADEARGLGVDPAFVTHLPAASVASAGAALRAAWPRDDAAFARAVHALLLGDEAGAAADAARLRDGLDRAALVRELAGRPGVAERVPGAGRLPPPDVRTAAALRRELQGIASLPTPAFVGAAHALLLGRAPDAGEAARLVAMADDGPGRAAVVRSLAGSREGVARGVPADAVRSALRRSPPYLLADARSARRRDPRALLAAVRRRLRRQPVR